METFLEHVHILILKPVEALSDLVREIKKCGKRFHQGRAPQKPHI
jgi:hypothetical protein